MYMTGKSITTMQKVKIEKCSTRAFVCQYERDEADRVVCMFASTWKKVVQMINGVKVERDTEETEASWSTDGQNWREKYRKRWRTTDLETNKDTCTEQEMDVSDEAQMYVCPWVCGWAATKLPASHLTEQAHVHSELCQSQREDWQFHLPNMLASLWICMWYFADGKKTRLGIYS